MRAQGSSYTMYLGSAAVVSYGTMEMSGNSVPRAVLAQ